MTGPRADRRRLLLAALCAALYVALCTGLATLVVAGTAPTLALPLLLALLLPAAIIPFGIVLNLVFLAEGFPEGWAWQPAFVLFTAALAVLQVWLFRAMARNWRGAEMRRTPVSSAADTGP